MLVSSPDKAVEYFEAKLEFTTGPVELNDLMKRGEEINIIDVRHAEDYRKGHIPKAKNLPQEKWSSFTGLSKDMTNIIYCYSQVCHLAASAARKFAEAGYPVMELDGGFDQWQRHRMAIEK